MSVTRIISSGIPGAETAALDAAIRFRVPYQGYTNQGSLMSGDRPAGRYQLEERPFVHPFLLLEANLAGADGMLLFSSGPLPLHLKRLEAAPHLPRRPALHIDFDTMSPRQAAFRIASWVREHDLACLLVTGTALREDKDIYQRVHTAMTALFMLADVDAGASQGTLH